MKRFLLNEKFVLLIGFIGLALAGSDAVDPVWPFNVLIGALLLALAGLLALSRPAPRR